jgi:hypothetical protein
MFDVFYLDRKPGLFAHEHAANSIEHAQALSRTRYLWIVDHHNDYSGFDWLWEPVPWQADQAHVWPSQHQANSGTWLIPKAGYQDVNRDHAPVMRSQSVPRLHIKHTSHGADQGDINTRFISDYLGTLRRALSRVTWQYCWVTADVCDYQDFDFTWHPSEWQDRMLHVFASGTYSDVQKFGDTFFVHVPSFLEKSQNLELLEWYDTLHFVPDVSVPRRTMPKVHYTHDSLVDELWKYDFQEPVVEFFRHWPAIPRHIPAINLWRQPTRSVVPLSAGACSVIVPRDVKNFLKTQIYDYPTIDRTRTSEPEPVLDVVFISNGEAAAEHHHDFLMMSLAANNSRNRLHRVDGVNGRVACYQAAARASTTDWFFAVFAKLQVNEDFDWSWQPDRLQQPKHYIFHAYNPVNHLIYGHQAMIAYNRRLVLENTGQGLDFTLDQPHEVVPIVSGTAYYDGDAWTCWRTAFRECLKLRHSLPDVENEYRLEKWLEPNDEDDYVKWSHIGAQDAMRYYDEVKGDFAEIKKSYEWAWLASYALMIHPQLITQSRT